MKRIVLILLLLSLSVFAGRVPVRTDRIARDSTALHFLPELNIGDVNISGDLFASNLTIGDANFTGDVNIAGTLTLPALTAIRLMATNSSKHVVSSDLFAWIAVVSNELDIIDDGDGTVTLGIVNPLIVGKGGSGAATFTDGGILLGSGTGPFTALGQATNGQLPIGSSGVDSVLATLTGTTDHIVITNAAGSITIDLGANTQTLLDSFNGTFLETIDFTIAEAGGTVTGSLEQDGGGDLTQRFSDGYTTLDCTGPVCTIDLTAFVGTDAVPKEVFVYILQSGKTTLVASNSDWPATEHIKIANLLLKSAVTTGTDSGALINRNWNDHAQDSINIGHVTNIGERLRWEPAAYKSGTALTIKDSAGNDLPTGNSSTAIELVVSEGKVFQLHEHTFPAADMFTGDDAHIVNQATDEGGAYSTTTDLVTDITVYDDGTASGTAIGINKYFNLVIWGVQNRTGEISHLMINIPTGQYTSSSNAQADVDASSVYNIPAAFRGTGFLIARITMRRIAGAQWTYIAQEDLRGLVPSASAGVAVSATDHALLANLIAPADDHTQYILHSLSTVGSDFLVGSGANTYVKKTLAETGAILEADIDHGNIQGLSDGSDHSFIDQSVVIAASPTFTDLTISAPVNIYGLSHDSFTDFVSAEHEDHTTWAGSSSITTLGTIATGVWEATDIAVLHGGTGASTLADLITLTTHTTGNYIATITDGLAIDGGVSSEGGTPTISFDPTELLGSRTWGDGSTDTIVWTWDRATGADPTITFNNGSLALPALTLVTDLAIAEGGTGQSTAQLAINALSAVGAATNEHVLTKDTGTSNAIWKVLPASGPHTHDGDTLQLDGVNSDGGAFPFATTGAVTFTQNLIIPDNGDLGSVTDPDAIMISAVGDVTLNDGNIFVAADNARLRVNGTGTSTTGGQHAIRGDITVSPSASSVRTYSGIRGFASSSSSNLTAGSSINGLIGGIIWTGAGTLPAGAGFTFASAMNAGTVTEYSGIKIIDMNKLGGTLTTDYGIQIAAITAGATNYAIYTNAGLVRFGGAVEAATTFESTGIATLADGSLLKTSAAPTTDAMIANKKYVDDRGYVDRGDPAAVDYVVGDLTTNDGAWHDLDLGAAPANVPTGVKAVVLRVKLSDDAAGSLISFRKKGNSNDVATHVVRSQVIGVVTDGSHVVSCDSNQELQYLTTNTTFTIIDIVVTGWFF